MANRKLLKYQIYIIKNASSKVLTSYPWTMISFLVPERLWLKQTLPRLKQMDHGLGKCRGEVVTEKCSGKVKLH